MNVYEYLQRVRDQITTPGIREAIERELAAHLEDQKADYMEEGMTASDAEEAAVLEMGDPVEVGLSLDELHRPKPAKKYVTAFFCLNLILILFNFLHIIQGQGITWTVGTVAAFLIAEIFFWVLYGVLAFYKPEEFELGKIFQLAGNLGIVLFAQVIMARFRVGGVALSDSYGFHVVFLLLFGYLGVLFHYRLKKNGWWKSQLIGAILLLAAGLMTQSFLFFGETAVIYGILYTSVFRRGWFPLCRRRILLGAWAGAALCAGIYAGKLFATPAKLRSLFEKAATFVSGGDTPVLYSENNFSYLPGLCQKVGFWPAYLLLAAGILFLIILIYYRRKLSNEWGRAAFLVCSLILAAMLLNGILALGGVIRSEMAFAPFLWNLTGQYHIYAEIDYAQISACYLIAGCLTRFTIRDSTADLEEENRRILACRGRRTADSVKNI